MGFHRRNFVYEITPLKGPKKNPPEPSPPKGGQAQGRFTRFLKPQATSHWFGPVNFYNHAHRLRLEKLSYIEVSRSPSGYFKPLLDPDGGFNSETAVRRFQKWK
jgi:hypothetical protein